MLVLRYDYISCDFAHIGDNLCEAFRPLAELEQPGHKTIDIKLLYAHLNPSHKRKAIESLKLQDGHSLVSMMCWKVLSIAQVIAMQLMPKW